MWRRSSYSEPWSNCVEGASRDTAVGLCDSKYPDVGHLTTPWTAYIERSSEREREIRGHGLIMRRALLHTPCPQPPGTARAPRCAPPASRCQPAVGPCPDLAQRCVGSCPATKRHS